MTKKDLIWLSCFAAGVAAGHFGTKSSDPEPLSAVLEPAPVEIKEALEAYPVVIIGVRNTPFGLTEVATDKGVVYLDQSNTIGIWGHAQALSTGRNLSAPALGEMARFNAMAKYRSPGEAVKLPIREAGINQIPANQAPNQRVAEQIASIRTAPQIDPKSAVEKLKPAPKENLTAIPKIGFAPDGSVLSKSETEVQVQSLFSKLDDSWVVTYPAVGEEKAQVAVFHSHTCGYCRRLHADLDKITAAGVTVKMLFYPRSGHADENQQMLSAWCAPDQTAGLNALYRNTRLNHACESLPEDVRQQRHPNPIHQHQWLGQVFGVPRYGTPTVFTSEGQVFSGYRNLRDFLAKVL
ncbi:thioredoxin fold domain-containing protein [Ferrimonas marina]|uniref:Thioredoxin-like domain-containing protein n=1 Tax=Ferrimonas marina TaxID=299255 RepID=A0A1M5THX4_9GAMM|nr:thioredoxin fold domain-containing protein [Ferrimonas marina]SHH49953.1 Thioredoxin-like domain-containing protein [Ferrimonas marina]